MPSIGGEMQRREPTCILCILRVPVREQFDDVWAPLEGCEMQRRSPMTIASQGIAVGSAREQLSDDVYVPAPGGEMQRREPICIVCIGVGSAREQFDDGVYVPLLGGEMQRRLPMYESRGIAVGSVRK